MVEDKKQKDKKRLLKSERPKKRYLVFEVFAKEKITNPEVVARDLILKFREQVGEFGFKNSGIKMINERWNSEMQRGVIKVNNDYLKDIKETLPLIKEIGGIKLSIKSVGVSGILNKAAKKYLGDRK